MTLTVNGERKTFAEQSLTVSEILKLCKVEMPDMVSVQVNGAFVDRKQYEVSQVTDGDSIDFLYFMGGGKT